MREAHQTAPSCQGVPPSERLYGFELTTLAPKNQLRTEPMRYGSLADRTLHEWSYGKDFHRLSQTGSLAKIEMKAHGMNAPKAAFMCYLVVDILRKTPINTQTILSAHSDKFVPVPC